MKNFKFPKHIDQKTAISIAIGVVVLIVLLMLAQQPWKSNSPDYGTPYTPTTNTTPITDTVNIKPFTSTVPVTP
jgi:hypothetical protein